MTYRTFAAGDVGFRLLGGALSPCEEEWIRSFEASGVGPVFDLDVERPGDAEAVGNGEWGRPADVRSSGGSVLVRGYGFEATIDFHEARAALRQRGDDVGGLQIALKVALACFLPSRGGVLLHSAAVLAPKGVLLFFGPSGAGKSTISGTSPYPVLTDELVALLGPAPFRASATGFWGTMAPRECSTSSGGVAALFELAKGPSFRLERLTPAAAFRRLLGVVLAPDEPGIWSSVLAVLRDLGAMVPCYRMEWALDEPPWRALEETGTIR